MMPNAPRCLDGQTIRVDELVISEQRLIAFIRALGYGELLIKVKDGQPVYIERPLQAVKLI